MRLDAAKVPGLGTLPMRLARQALRAGADGSPLDTQILLELYDLEQLTAGEIEQIH